MAEQRVPKAVGDLCRNGHPVVRKPNMFYWRGVNFSGLVCETCRALWDDPADSFWMHVTGKPYEPGEEVKGG